MYRLLYINLMVSTNQKYVKYIHTKKRKNPNIDLKTVIRSQRKRTREERNREELQKQSENNEMALSTYI